MNKNTLWGIFAVIIVIACGFTFIFDDFEHIEDTNGPSTAINRITNEQIIDATMGAKGLNYSRNNSTILGFSLGGVKFSSKQYTGVTEIFYTDFILPSTFELEIYNYEINEGNFELVIINEGKIIGRVSNEDPTFVVDNIKGTLQLMAVGESANFSFEMTTFYFDLYAHPKF